MKKNGEVNQRFSLRSLLIFTTILCGICALLAPWFSRLESDGKFYVCTILVFHILVSAILVSLLYMLRRRVKAKAGEFMLYVNPNSPAVNLFWMLTTIVIFAGILAFVILTFAPLAGDMNEFPGGFGLTRMMYIGTFSVSIFPLVAGTHNLIVFFWGLSWFGAELYQKGLCVSGIRFIRWHSVKSYEWIETPKLWQLKIKVGFGTVFVLCANDLKEKAESILESAGISD